MLVARLSGCLMSAPSPIRRSIVFFLLTFGLSLVLLGTLLTYANRALFDRKSFADRARAVASRTSGRRSLLADRISRAAVAANRDLTAYRPLLVYGAREVVSSEPFAALMRSSIATLHFVVFSQGGEDVLLNLSDAGILLKSALPALPPRLAEKIPGDVAVRLSDEASVPYAVYRAIPSLRKAAAWSASSWWVLAGGAALLILAALISPTPVADRPRDRLAPRCSRRCCS